MRKQSHIKDPLPLKYELAIVLCDILPNTIFEDIPSTFRGNVAYQYRTLERNLKFIEDVVQKAINSGRIEALQTELSSRLSPEDYEAYKSGKGLEVQQVNAIREILDDWIREDDPKFPPRPVKSDEPYELIWWTPKGGRTKKIIEPNLSIKTKYDLIWKILDNTGRPRLGRDFKNSILEYKEWLDEQYPQLSENNKVFLSVSYAIYGVSIGGAPKPGILDKIKESIPQTIGQMVDDLNAGLYGEPDTLEYQKAKEEIMATRHEAAAKVAHIKLSNLANSTSSGPLQIGSKLIDTLIAIEGISAPEDEYKDLIYEFLGNWETAIKQMVAASTIGQLGKKPIAKDKASAMAGTLKKWLLEDIMRDTAGDNITVYRLLANFIVLDNDDPRKATYAKIIGKLKDKFILYWRGKGITFPESNAELHSDLRRRMSEVQGKRTEEQSKARPSPLS